ncbi:MAG TPA: TolC family protein [Polyangia bacterium]|nr:TolC family protein [Polyangia bacterium]
MTPLAIALSTVLLAATVADGEPAFSERLRAETGVVGGLTATEAARRAETTSGDVAARQAEIDAAEAAVTQTGIGFFPRLAGGARYTRLSNIEAPLFGVSVVAPGAPVGPLPANTPLVNVPVRFPVLLDQTSFQGTLAVPLSDYFLRIGPAYAAAMRTEAAARFAHDAARRRVAAEVKALYYEWARTRLSRLAEEAAVAQARGHLDDVSKAFAAGSASRADVLRVEAQLAGAEQAAVGTTTLSRALQARLETVMHVGSGAPLAVGEAIASDFNSALAERDLDRLTAAAVGARPEIRGLDATAAALGRQARAAAGAGAPVLAVVGEITDANPNPRYIPSPDRFATTWSASAQITWSPNDAATSYEAYRGLRARQAQVAETRRALVDQVRSEIAGALQAVDNAASAQLTSARAARSAEESYRVRRSLFQNGRATSVELTDAETELTRARLAVISARIDARLADVALLRALGRDTPDARPALVGSR